MNYRILTIGRPRLGFIAPGVEMYQKRLSATGGCQWVALRDGPDAAERMLRAIGDGPVIVLDNRGEAPDSVALARKITRWESEGRRQLQFLIGGADGHPQSLRERADWMWSLGPLTLQHEIALLVVMEQLYRAESIRRGDPYHRS